MKSLLLAVAALALSTASMAKDLKVSGTGNCEYSYCSAYGVCTPIVALDGYKTCKKMSKELAKENAAKACEEKKGQLKQGFFSVSKSLNCNQQGSGDKVMKVKCAATYTTTCKL